MNQYRESLIDRMVRIYGLENPIVIDFVRLCERLDLNAWNDTTLELLVEAHEENPQIEAAE